MKISEIVPPQRGHKQFQLNFKGEFEQKLHDQYDKLLSSEQSKNEMPSLQWQAFQNLMKSKYDPTNISEEDTGKLLNEMYENGFITSDEYQAIFQKNAIKAQTAAYFNVINFNLEFHGDLLSYIRHQIADTMQRLHCINTGYFAVSDDGKDMIGTFKEELQTRATLLENVYNLLAKIKGISPYAPENKSEEISLSQNDQEETKIVDNPLFAPLALKNGLYTFTEDWFLQIWNRVFTKEKENDFI